MNIRKLIPHFALLLLPLFFVGLIISFLIELWTADHPGVDWTLAVLITLGLDVVLTFLQNRRQTPE